MDFGLTTEQQMVVDTVRGFVEKELYPHEEEVERTGQVSADLGRERSSARSSTSDSMRRICRWRSAAAASTT